MVIKELSLNNTYKEVHNNNVNVISRHLDYIAKNGIDVPEQPEHMPSFYCLAIYILYLSCRKNLRFQVHCCFQKMHYKTTLISSLLTSCLKPYLLIINNIVMVFITILELTAFGLSIYNSTEILDRLQQINKTSRVRRFDSYDFATL